MNQFCTAITCMDGRIQIPVIHYLKKHFDAAYVDTITEPGPNCILGLQKEPEKVKSILERVKISVDVHKSSGIAIIGHEDCAGNPASEEEQSCHIRSAQQTLRQHYPGIPILGLWINLDGKIKEVPREQP